MSLQPWLRFMVSDGGVARMDRAVSKRSLTVAAGTVTRKVGGSNPPSRLKKQPTTHHFTIVSFELQQKTYGFRADKPI